MFNKISILLLAVLVLNTRCLAKKTNKSKSENKKQDEQVLELDQIEVKPEEKPKSKLYRASNARSNDILHTKLEVKFDWQNSWLFGKATIDLKPYFYPTSTLFLDARGMDLFKVQLISNGKASDLKYKYENDSIKIELDKTYTRDDKYTVFIEYKAKPEDLKQGGSNAITSDKGLYFINPKGKDSDKMPQIWTQGETQSSSAWFPTIDSPNERMTEEIYITVDDKYTTLSNGILKDQNKNTDGTRTDHWVMDMPHAPYLVMMGIGEFKIVKDSWKGKDVWYYVEKPYEKYARAIFGNTPEMLEFFSNKLGVQYPWQKYSQIVCRDYVSGAMENTTATLHGEFLYSTDRELLDSDQESVIAHELFHQWFGDLVTCESWSNLPLNESFATYGEYLWNEYKYGRDKADEEGYYSRAGYMAESQRKKTELIRFEYKDKEDMFDAHSYNKGGQILNMLRRYVGDDAFFASLKLYLERNKFNSAEIHNLRLCFEEVTGEDLNWFFNQWFLSKGHPVLKIDRNYDSINKKVILKIVQKQDFEKGTPLFKLPVNVDVYDEGKITRNLIWIKEAEQVFEIVGINSKPDLINFDADKVLLGEIKENKTFDEYVFQYKKAPLYLDRYEALEYLSDKFENPNTYNVLEDATRDKYEGLRKKAISNLSAFATKNEAKLKPIMINLAKFDVNAGVRSEALNFIVNNYNSAFMKDLYLDALKDKSYTVIAYALDGLKTLDKKLALEKARELEKEESTIIMFTLMKTYSENGSDQDLSYFIQNAKNASGFEEVGYYNLFGNFLKNCNDETTINGITFIKNRVKNSGNRYAVFAGRRSILNQKTKYEELESELKSKIEAAKTNNQDPKKLEERLSQVISTKEKIQAIYQEATSE